MRVISVNVGLPRTVQWKGKAVSTGIFKAPVSGRIHSRTLNLDGDRQADLSVHGGPDKAVYVYPVEQGAGGRTIPATLSPRPVSDCSGLHPGVERPVVRSYSLSDVARNDHYRLTIKRIASRSGDSPTASGLASDLFPRPA